MCFYFFLDENEKRKKWNVYKRLEKGHFVEFHFVDNDKVDRKFGHPSLRRKSPLKRSLSITFSMKWFSTKWSTFDEVIKFDFRQNAIRRSNPLSKDCVTSFVSWVIEANYASKIFWTIVGQNYASKTESEFFCSHGMTLHFWERRKKERVLFEKKLLNHICLSILCLMF